MVVGVCKICLHFSEAFSLKEKRMILKSVIEKLKNKFHVSVAEVSEQEKYQLSEIGIACVSNRSSHAESMLSKICDFIEGDARLLICNIETEVIHINS